MRGDALEGLAALLAVFAGWREGRGEMAAEEGLADEVVAGGVVGLGRVHVGIGRVCLSNVGAG